MIACACADRMGPLLSAHCGGRCKVAIPAKTGILGRVSQQGRMDARFRRNDDRVVETPSNFFFNRTTA